MGCAFCVYDKNSTIFDIQFDNMSAAHLCKYTILIGMIDNCKFELYNRNDEMFIKYDMFRRSLYEVKKMLKRMIAAALSTAVMLTAVAPVTNA